MNINFVDFIIVGDYCWCNLFLLIFFIIFKVCYCYGLLICVQFVSEKERERENYEQIFYF